ncbi:hypothetical protein [Streptomyces sp. NBC_01602]|uniref:hypothetical protein n=1 Tax=Streptomyces sp. NBC_01602 TaxID=2975893 RepID=UPI003867CC8F|nr:hypothetical protein OG955_03000 [Streptomyces sp. NBC_01602]
MAYAEILAGVCATRRRLTREERETLQSRGERAAQAGIGLRARIRAHLSAAQRVRPDLPQAAAHHLRAAVEQAVDAFAGGREGAQHLVARRGRQREFIDYLLYGCSDLGHLAERAERFGLLLSHANAVAVAQGHEPYSNGYAVTRTVESSHRWLTGSELGLRLPVSGMTNCLRPCVVCTCRTAPAPEERMYLVPLLLGLGLILVGLALATDHRGIAQRTVDTYLNPAHADPSLLRAFNRLGFEHPGMDFLRYTPRQRRLVRIWGGFLSVFGLAFLAAGIVLLVHA